MLVPIERMHVYILVETTWGTIQRYGIYPNEQAAKRDLLAGGDEAVPASWVVMRLDNYNDFLDEMEYRQKVNAWDCGFPTEEEFETFLDNLD